MTIETSRTARLQGLDWIRGFAALWVLFYHLDITLQKTKYFSLPPLSPVTSVGHRGVELFFLLSGFVMARSYTNSGASGARDGIRFLVRRVFRIFPAFIAVFLPLFAAAAYWGAGAPPNTDIDAKLFVMDLFLLPRDDLQTFIPVSAWTLTHEMMFYTIFMVWFFSRQGFWIILGAWAFASLALTILDLRPAGWAMQFGAENAYFLLGILCSMLAQTFPWRSRWLMPIGIVTALAGAITLEVGNPTPAPSYSAQAFYVLAFFGVIYWTATNHPRLPAPVASAADYLGRISYGVYLVNYPLIVIAAMIAKRLHADAFATFWVGGFALLATLLLSMALHNWIERPAIRFGNTLFGQRRMTVTTELHR